MRGSAAVLLLLAVASVALADSRPGDTDRRATLLDEVVVVATKRETSIRDVAADITVIDDADLEALLSASLADALRFVPGVTHESSGSRFGNEGISIRGIGGNRIAMELDGVPLSDQFDIGNFSSATRDFADSGLLGQVEIMRGPASALYGGSALGGVVAMRTLDPQHFATAGGTSGSAGALYRGIDESTNTQASLVLNGAPVSLVLAGSYREGAERQSAALDEPADTQSYRRDAVLMKLVGRNRFGDGWQIGAIRQSHDAQTRITSVLGAGRFRSTTRLDGDDSHSMELLSGEYHFDTSWFSDGVARAFVANAEIHQYTYDERAAARTPVLIDRDFYYKQQRRGAELNLWRDEELRGWNHRFGVGLEYTETRTEEQRDGLSTSLTDGSVSSDILGERFPLRDFPVTDTREFGAYLSDEVARGPLSLIFALRFDDNRLTPNNDPIYAADNPETAVVALSDSDLSPKLAAIYRLDDDVDIFLQYARGFRAPPFEDANIGLDIPLFNIRAIPNPNLKSETSDGWEFGMRWQGERSRLQFSAFHTAYSDFIETKVRIGIDPDSGRLLFQSINIGDAVIRGVEARWARDLTGPLEGTTLHAAAYQAQGDNRDNGQPLNSVGPAEAVIGSTWRSADERTEIRALLTATRAWSRLDETAGALFQPAGYAVLDLFFARTIGERVVLRASIGNATDRTYWRWSEVRGLAPDDALIPTLAEAGRHYSIGLQWSW